MSSRVVLSALIFLLVLALLLLLTDSLPPSLIIFSVSDLLFKNIYQLKFELKIFFTLKVEAKLPQCLKDNFSNNLTMLSPPQ